MGRCMIRVILMAVVAGLAAGCYYDRNTGHVRFAEKQAGDSDSTSDSLEHNMAIQGYMRDHHGKMPPPDYPIYP